MKIRYIINRCTGLASHIRLGSIRNICTISIIILFFLKFCNLFFKFYQRLIVCDHCFLIIRQFVISLTKFLYSGLVIQGKCFLSQSIDTVDQRCNCFRYSRCCRRRRCGRLWCCGWCWRHSRGRLRCRCRFRCCCWLWCCSRFRCCCWLWCRCRFRCCSRLWCRCFPS